MSKQMKMRLIVILSSIIVVLIIIYAIVSTIACNRAKYVCDLIFESKGIYDDSYVEVIDEKSFEDLSAKIIYYMHSDIPRGADFEVLNYNVKTSLSPLDFIFYGEINLKCQYSIKYKEQTYQSVLSYEVPEIIRAKVRLENWKFKVYYEFPPI